MEVKKDKEIIDRILEKGTEQIIPSKEALREQLESGKRLKIYQGFDPTADTLHIGHTVGMRKLEDFRKLGHEVIFLVGDFTARIGDPSDKSATRQKLSKEDVETNMKEYIDQANHIVDVFNKENPVTILYNSQWLEKLDFGDILELTSKFTVQQMIKRDMFQKRLDANKPIHISEFLYPLMQAYDSLQMDVDIEVGGNDQLFNMLAGRDLMMNEKGKEKFVITGKLLTAPDGVKMGKSEGNMIKMNDKPEEIYGKVMAFTDEMIVNAFEILTNCTMEEVNSFEERIKEGENPMNIKKELAYMITSEITNEESAKKAQKYFESVFQSKDEAIEIPEKEIDKKELPLNQLLVDIGFAESKSAARRLVEQGAVKIDDIKATQFNQTVIFSQDLPVTIRAGRQLCKLILKA